MVETKPSIIFSWSIRHFSRFFESCWKIYSPYFTVFQNKSSNQQIRKRMMLMNDWGQITGSFCYSDKEEKISLRILITVGSINKTYFEDDVDLWDEFILGYKEDFLPGDLYTVRCTVWPLDRKTEETRLCFAMTDLLLNDDDHFFWPIRNFSSLQTGKEITFLKKPNLSSTSLVTLKLILLENQKLQFITTWHNPSDLFNTIWKISIINGLGEATCTTTASAQTGTEKDLKFVLPKNKEELNEDGQLNLPNDVLILKLCCSKICSSEILYDSLQPENFPKSYSDVQKYIPGTFTEAMKNLFKDNLFSDFNFIIGSQEFPVHKAVLCARSPVFKAMFTTDMKEKSEACEELSDIDPEIFYRVLLYIYTDTVTEMQFEDAVALYSAADKYELIPLKSICTSFLKANVCVANVCDILVLSDMHSDDNLKKFAQDFIFEYGTEILRSDTWKNIREHHISLASETTEYMFLKGH